ncbi:hypothetical protein [Planktothrix phage Pra-JY27]|nr:hypothetical protein [Planktothrix phage Pag-Yong1]WEV89202.1 hypothetical protein [Synechococcus phage MinM2]
MLLDPYRFGRPLLGRTFLPTSGGQQAIFSGINVPWDENLDAVDPLGTFPASGGGSANIEAPTNANFADVECQITVRNSLGAPACTAQFVLQQSATSTFTSPTSAYTAGPINVPGNSNTDFQIVMPITRISLAAGKFFRVRLTQVGSSSLGLRRGTAVSWIDIDWRG